MSVFFCSISGVFPGNLKGNEKGKIQSAQWLISVTGQASWRAIDMVKERRRWGKGRSSCISGFSVVFLVFSQSLHSDAK